METKIAGHAGNENTGSHGIIKDAVVPQHGGNKAAGTGGPATAAIPFSRGTTDIAHRLKNGETVYFEATEQGMRESELYFMHHAKDVFAIHFGETCAYIKREKIVAQVHMSRAQFFEAVKP